MWLATNGMHLDHMLYWMAVMRHACGAPSNQVGGPGTLSAETRPPEYLCMCCQTPPKDDILLAERVGLEKTSRVSCHPTTPHNKNKINRGKSRKLATVELGVSRSHTKKKRKKTCTYTYPPAMRSSPFQACKLSKLTRVTVKTQGDAEASLGLDPEISMAVNESYLSGLTSQPYGYPRSLYLVERT